MKAERILSIPGAVNLRELGGYQNIHGQTIKWHKLLRSGELSALPKSSVKELTNYGLTYDIDLRSPSEVHWSPDKIDSSVIFKSYPAYPFDNGEKSDIPKTKELIYQSDFPINYDPYLTLILNPSSRLAFRSMFLDLLNNTEDNHALLFHCSAGKDRTGIAAMLILGALEVPFQTIKDDYLLTNLINSRPDLDKLRNQINSPTAARFIQEMNQTFNVFASNLKKTYQLILNQFGSFDNYLITALELSSNDLARLRKIYLE